MSCASNRALDTLARLAGVATTDLDRAWATAATARRVPEAVGWAVITDPTRWDAPDIAAPIAGDVAAAAEVVMARPELRGRGDLLAAIATDAAQVVRVVQACPDLRSHPALRARIATDRPATVDALVWRCSRHARRHRAPLTDHHRG